MHDLVRQQRTSTVSSGRRQRVNESITKPAFVFFHLAKNGGGSISWFLRPIRDSWYHAGHRETLPGLAERFPQSPIVFFVRHPVSRFVSGFYNLHRARSQGVRRLPSTADVLGFNLFPTPDDLLSGLRSADEWTRSAAEYAMNNLPFLRNPLANNLISTATVDAHLSRIAFIGTQENFSNSVEAMRTALSLPASLSLNANDRKSHRSPATLRTTISDENREVLLEWYRDDLVLYEHCRQIHERHMERFT